MNKKAISKLVALLLTMIMCFSVSVNAFAATPETEISTEESEETMVAPCAYEVLMSTHMTGYQKTGYFYVPSCGILGNTYYFTFTGDSGAYVNFTVYYGNQAYTSGSYLANGTSHSQRLVLPVGTYSIKMNTSSPNSILCVVAYDR